MRHECWFHSRVHVGCTLAWVYWMIRQFPKFAFFFFFKFLLIFKQIGSSWIFEVFWSAFKINKAKQFQTIFLTFHPFLLPLVWLWILHVVLVLVPFSVDPLVPNFNFAQTFCLVCWQRLTLVKLATCISLMCHFCFVFFSLSLHAYCNHL